MTASDFKFIIGVLILVIVIVHTSHGAKKDKGKPKKMARRSPALQILVFLGFLSWIVLWVIFLFSSLLDGFNAAFPEWLRWIGILLLFTGDVVLILAHTFLGNNWALNPQIKVGQTLVVNGIYKWIRHPMYASYLMISLGFLLSSTNLLLGLTLLTPVSAICIIRIGIEDKMMLEQFGDEFQAYKAKTGSLWPKINR